MFNTVNILVTLSFFVSIVLLIKFYRNLFSEFSGYLLVLLGFAVFVFLDIVKSSVILDDPRVIKNSTKLLTTLYSFLSLLLFLAGYHFSKFKNNIFKSSTEHFHAIEKINYKKFEKLIVILLLYACLFTFYLKNWNNHYVQATSSIQKSAIIVCLYVFLKTHKKKYFLVTLILIFLNLFETSRRIYTTIFVAALAVFLSYLKNRDIIYQKKIKLVLSITFILFFIFLNYLRSGHNFGYGFNPNNKVENTINYILTLKSLDTFYNTGFTIETVPDRFEYLYGSSYAALLFGFIPRNLWPEKPLSYASDIAFRQRTNFKIESTDDWLSVNQYSLSPGFIGEAYANFGFIGVVILSYLFGVFTKYFDTKKYYRSIFSKPTQLPYLALYPIFILILRGDFYAAIIFSIQIFIFIKIILWIIISRKRIKV